MKLTFVLLIYAQRSKGKLHNKRKENSITKNIAIFFFEPLNFANYLQLLFGYYSQFNSVLLFCLKDQMIFKNEEETETITFQISTTELTKRKAKKIKVKHWQKWKNVRFEGMYRCKRFSITVECIRYLRYFAVVFGMILAAAAFFLVLQILLLLLFQDVYLYGIFTFLNGALGLMILVLHSSTIIQVVDQW